MACQREQSEQNTNRIEEILNPVAHVDVVAEFVEVDDRCAMVQLHCSHLTAWLIRLSDFVSEQRDHRGLSLAQLMDLVQVDDVLRLR